MFVTRHAFCVSGERLERRVSSFGVYSDDGLVPFCDIKTGSWTSRPTPKAIRPRSVSQIAGPSLFAGSANSQFGFVLLNSLGRLWAAEEMATHTTLVFASRPLNGPNRFTSLLSIVRSMGMINPIAIVDGNMHFEQLHSAPEIFGEATQCKAQDGFYDWLDRRWPPRKITPGRKIYLTRSAMGARAGRFVCEKELETLLIKEGYEIIIPEALSLQDQLEVLQTAEKLIFSEGSAVHLYSLLRQPGQISAVIQRRKTLPPVMESQMQDRVAAPFLAVNAIDETYWPSRRGDFLAVSTLDFDRLRDALKASGLILGDDWVSPTPKQIRASLQASVGEGETLHTEEERLTWLRTLRRANQKPQRA